MFSALEDEATSDYKRKLVALEISFLFTNLYNIIYSNQGCHSKYFQSPNIYEQTIHNKSVIILCP